MNKPVIGITTGEDKPKEEPWRSLLCGQTQPYITAVLAAGGVPLLLPIVDNEAAERVLYELCDGLLFAGGNDIDPQEYGQTATQTLESISARRDAQERRLLEWTLADNKPLLGICRGMQMLNVVRGGTLLQDIKAAQPQAQDHEVSSSKHDYPYVAHQLTLEADSHLARMVGASVIAANSSHHQAVDKLALGLRRVGWAEDGITEAIELEGSGTPELPFAVAVQPHPESMLETTEPRWAGLFTAFVDACAPDN